MRDALLNDPAGERFPWPAPPLDEVLRGVELEGSEEKKKYEDLPPDAVRVFYFAAHWVRFSTLSIRQRQDQSWRYRTAISDALLMQGRGPVRVFYHSLGNVLFL